MKRKPGNGSEFHFAVSSCAFPGMTMEQVEDISLKNGLSVEFSSGFRHEPDLAEKFITSRCSRLIHNYFPPPLKPFVLNLASLDRRIWRKSVEHGRQAIQLADAVGCPFYSIHAGFCVDPSTRELGRPFLGIRGKTPFQKHWDVFLKAIRILLKESERFNVSLLIENNVTIRQNITAGGKSVLLCSSPQDIKRLLKEVSDPYFGLLLDTGHLKVSARSLGFDKRDFLKAASSQIRAIHHNDNNGAVDNNQSLGDSYWFLRHMPKFSRAFHILEVYSLTPAQIKAQKRLLQEAANQ